MALSENRWWTKETVAIVTGANRGIGLEIARQLADNDILVLMTARKPESSLSDSAKAFLQEGRKNVIFHVLDINSAESVSDFTKWVKEKIGVIDILINNAGVAMSEVDWEFMEKNKVNVQTIIGDISFVDGITEKYELAKQVIETNYYGTKRITEALIPLLRQSPTTMPRVVNVSSYCGLLQHLKDDNFKNKLMKVDELDEKTIDDMLTEFLEDIKCVRDLKTSKWPVKFSSYSVSKMALNAYSRLLARDLNGQVCVNSVHPGYVKTDMTLGTGDILPAQGAENIVRVALFPPGGPSGKNFMEDKEFVF